MRKFFGLSAIALFALLASFQVGVSSCTKDKTIYDTVTVTKKDTVTLVQKDTLVIQDTSVTLELLTANTWKMQEIRGVIGNNILYYKRGGTTNTENYDDEYITFYANKTGILFDAAGGLHQLTWDFSNATKTKITFVVQNPAPLTSQIVVYENLRYKNKALLFDQYWSYNNINSHAQAVRIPMSN